MRDTAIRLIKLVVPALALVACGTGLNEYNDTQVASVEMTTGATEIVADGSNQIVIRALVKDIDGNPIDNSLVKFSTTLGSLTASSAATDETGYAQVFFTSATVGTARVTANAGGVSVFENISVIAGSDESQNAAYLSLALSKATIKSNNADSVTITATLLDAKYSIVPGVQVNFSADSGQLSVGSVLTDEEGVAKTVFSSGSIDPSNRVAVVTASAGSLSKQIPIKVIGTEISLDVDTDILIIGGTSGSDTSNFTLKLVDGGELPVYDASVSLSVAGSGVSPGTATLSANSVTTDIEGQASFSVTGVAAGTVTVTASALGATYTKDLSINAEAAAFYISVPTSSPTSADIGDNVTVTVKAPTQTSVTFVTSLGTVSDGGPADVQVTTPVVAGQASVTLSSLLGGVATVSVYDTNDPTVTDRTYVAFASPSAQANSVTFQTDRYVLPLSTGTTTYHTTLTATVYDVNGFPVHNAVVLFSLSNTTGGGENVNPAWGLSGDDGRVKTSFTSGSLSTAPDGVSITATVAGVASDAVRVVIGGTAGSVVVGSSTKMESVNDNTAYRLPMSVLVSDSSGNPMAGTIVSLRARPMEFYLGDWNRIYGVGTDYVCEVAYDLANSPKANEDLNDNLVLDVGEDQNGDGQLTPPNSSAGTLPATVTTDEFGVATFDLIYLKQYAAWVRTTVTASTFVVGTETTTALSFILPVTKEDADECLVKASPFN